ncbi:hypothetical protein XarbCFBP8130_00205 [Xanthomonas arboricola]|nr:hypothetical protein XarbCFBP8130_00205 [Xanthomonas arboricola]
MRKCGSSGGRRSKDRRPFFFLRFFCCVRGKSRPATCIAIAVTASSRHPEHALTIDGYRPERRFFPGFTRNWREQIREQQQLVYLAPGPHAPGSLRATAVPSNMPSFA